MLRGGKSYVSARPAFATDAKRLLVCTGTAVSIFTTSTGLQISSLEGHNASVTSVIVVPGNKALSFCWTAFVDGTIRYWDFAVAELMKTIDIKMPIFSMVVPSTMGQPVKEHKKMILMQLTFFLVCLLKIPSARKYTKAIAWTDSEV
ncbi:hypothetical protein ACFX13_023049 [Malus domestica]